MRMKVKPKFKLLRGLSAVVNLKKIGFKQI